MIVTDTLSNLFSTIKNGYLSNKSRITHPRSNQSINILNIFIREGFIKSYKISPQNPTQLEIFLKYKTNKPVLIEIQRISKPGKRVYIKNTELFKKKRGFYILSTSCGLITDLQAKKLNLGGELLCTIY